MTRFVANLLWFLSTLPSALAFAVAARFPAHAQRRVAARLRHAADEPILRRVPTSGSTAATKWIPYTAELLRGFMRAVNPWVCSLYLRHPSLLFASHYWSISPYTETDASPAGEQGSRGFSDDAEYLGSFQQACARVLFPVTPLVKGVKDPERHAWLTLLGLLAAPRLGLISIWHPSAFLRLLERAQREADRLTAALASGTWGDGVTHPPLPRRAVEVSCALTAGDWTSIWPHLVVISCWHEAFAATDARRLAALFPRAELEGKGLLATEGVVTFPWFGRRVAAIRSHVLTLRAISDEEEVLPSVDPIPVYAAQPGVRYAVFLTTGKDTVDYPLNDIVVCTGRVARTPTFAFLHRAGGVVDLHGEKLHPGPVGVALAALADRCGGFATAYLQPRSDRRGYQLVCTPVSGARVPTVDEVEAELGQNYYYRHTRNLGQLDPVEIVVSPDALADYCRLRHLPPAAAKPPPLL